MRVNGRRASKRVSISGTNSPAPQVADKGSEPTDKALPTIAPIEAQDSSIVVSTNAGDSPAILSGSPETVSGAGTSAQHIPDTEEKGTVMGKRVNLDQLWKLSRCPRAIRFLRVPKAQR